MLHYFFQHIDRNSYFDILIETENLGKVSVVQLGQHASVWNYLAKPSWFVDYVSVYDWTSTFTGKFPCYHWIERGKHVSMTSKTSEQILFRFP